MAPRRPDGSSHRSTFLAVLLSLLPLGVLACGSEGAPAEQVEPPLQDTTVPPIRHEPLTEADRVGLEPMNLFMDLPWTGNQASRDPATAAAQATLLELDTRGADGFDRVVFTFTDDAAFPGYRVRVSDSTEVSCTGAEGGNTVTLDGGDRALVIRVEPARNESDTGVTVRTGRRELALSRFQRGGLVCAEASELVWAASLAEGDEIRVLELREPNRLVVDVR